MDTPLSKPVIDNWGACLDENSISGTILSFEAAYAGAPVIISSIKDLEKKVGKKREVTYTCRYTSEHLIPIRSWV